jgi:hypothetical protein
MQSLVDLFIGLSVLGGGAFVIAGVLAYGAGPSFRRTAVIALAGIPIAAGLFFLVWVDASPTEPCHDCGQILGRWMSGVIVFYLFVNVITWVAGAILGWAIRSRPRNVY